MNIEFAALILRVERIVLSAMRGFIDKPAANQKLSPSVIAVASKQGVVEVEQGEFCGCGGHGGLWFNVGGYKGSIESPSIIRTAQESAMQASVFIEIFWPRGTCRLNR